VGRAINSMLDCKCELMVLRPPASKATSGGVPGWVSSQTTLQMRLAVKRSSELFWMSSRGCPLDGSCGM